MLYMQKMPKVISFIIALAFLFPNSYPKKRESQFTVQVKVVSLDVEVLDSQGREIMDLDQKDFLVKENGAPVEISSFASNPDISLSLVIALGTSFMPQANLSIAKKTIFELIHMLKPEDEISLYTFNQKDAYLEQAFTPDRTKIFNALENIGVAAGSIRPRRFIGSFFTPPQTGLGLDLGLAAAKKGVHQRKALLLIRDRVESLGPASLEHVRASDCAYIGLGFTEEATNRLSLINEQSGTEQLILDRGADQASDINGNVTELCRTITRLLLSRYSITYYTSLPEAQKPRQIEVLVPGRDCRIVARRSNLPLKKTTNRR
jgi:hypothetical protein